jgi:hypothetical protein
MSNGKQQISVPVGDGQGTMKDVTPDNVHAGRSYEGQEERLMEHREEAAWERIGKAAKAFNEFHQAYGVDHNLSVQEVMAAAYLENLNIKEYYPEELGGPDGYDAECKAVWEWFEANKEPR